MRTVLSIVALVALAGGPAWAGSAREAIDAANQKFEAVFDKGDAAGVAQLYAEDAVLLPPGELRVEGRPAIEAYWKGTIDAGFKEITLKAGEVFEDGGAATEVGQWTIVGPTQSSGIQRMSGKYMVVWRQIGDRWQLYRDMWNDDPVAPK